MGESDNDSCGSDPLLKREFSKLAEPRPNKNISRQLMISPGSLMNRKPSRKTTRGPYSAAMERFVVVPEETRWLAAWDVWIILLLLVTTYYEPYAVAIMPADTIWASWLNHTLDMTFSVDIFLTFFIAYGEPLESASNSLWVKDPSRIAARYLSFPLSEGMLAGWFWIDVLTVLPGWLNLFMGSGVNPKIEHSLVLLRLLRLVRLTKLVRLQNLIHRWQIKFGFPFYVVELGKFFFITTVTIHWLACLWIVMEGRVTTSGGISYRTDKETWLTALVNAKGDSCTPSAAEDPNCVWIISLYWATMTLTTVGYGDITAQNPAEYVVCMLSMLIMGYVWAYVVGKMVTLLGDLDPEWQTFTRTMDTLQGLIDSRRLPKDLQVRLRKYMHESRSTAARSVQNRHLKDHVTQSLQREVAQCSVHVIEQFSKAVFWASDLQQDALLDIIRALEPCSFGPGEIMMLPQTLIFMRKGISAVKGRVLNRGDIVGHIDILLLTDALIENSFPRAMTYVDVLLLGRTQLLEVCQNFPHADKRLRRAQIRTATFRAFIKTAREARGDPVKSAATLRAATPNPPMASTASAPPSPNAVVATDAATSFVHPGESKLHMSSLRHNEETKISELKIMLKALMTQSASLEATLNRVEARQIALPVETPRKKQRF